MRLEKLEVISASPYIIIEYYRNLFSLSFWTRFWARKNPYSGWNEIVSFHLWFAHWEREILHCVQNNKRRFFFLNECERFFTAFRMTSSVCLSFWTRFRARKNPYSGWNEVVSFHLWFAHRERGILSCVQNDIWREFCPMRRWDSSPSFSNDIPGVCFFCHSERDFGRGRIPTVGGMK